MNRSSTEPLRWLFLNQSHSPEFQRLLEHLSEHLGKSLLITGMPFASQSEKLTCYRAPGYERRGFAQRALSWCKFCLKATSRSALVKDRPSVLAVTNPPLNVELAYGLWRARKMPYALLIWDIMPEAMVRLNWFSNGHPMIRTWQWLNRQAYRNAELIITLGPLMAETVKKAMACPERNDRVVIIPNWVDTKWLAPLEKGQNEFAKDHGQVGKITVLYSGNMGASHGLEPVIDAAEILKDDNRLSFLLIGDGLGHDQLRQEVTRRRLSNVVLLPRQPWEKLPQSLATGDIALVSQAPGMEGIAMPSKSYSSLATGSALLGLCARGSDLSELIESHDVGVVVSEPSPVQIAQAIKRLADDPDTLAQYRKNARKAAEMHFSQEVVYSRFRESLQAISRTR